MFDYCRANAIKLKAKFNSKFRIHNVYDIISLYYGILYPFSLAPYNKSIGRGGKCAYKSLGKSKYIPLFCKFLLFRLFNLVFYNYCPKRSNLMVNLVYSSEHIKNQDFFSSYNDGIQQRLSETQRKKKWDMLLKSVFLICSKCICSWRFLIYNTFI